MAWQEVAQKSTQMFRALGDHNGDLYTQVVSSAARDAFRKLGDQLGP
jgi:hypothetical protein